MKRKIITLVALGFAVSANAQKPFKELGLDNEVDVLTLSNGRYIEHFTYDTLRQIGSVIFNTKTHKVEYFITDDDLERQKVASRTKEVSRFLSVDPLTSKFPMLSPYQYASNSPIQNIDLDGLEGYKIVDAQAKKTTMVADIYYVPQTKDNLKVYNSGFTQEQAENMRAGIMTEFSKSKFLDNSNVDPISGQAYSADLQINLHPVSNKWEAYKAANEVYTNPLSSNMVLEKSQEKSIIEDGQIKIEKGGSIQGIMRVSSEDSHNATHELFHNFIHNHQNATEANKNLIKPEDQEPGHKKAGGIFIYENQPKGIKKENLNQQNINNALETLPEKK